LRRVAERLSPRARDARSPLEVDFLALCREWGLPEPQVNVLVAGLLVDFVWPRQRVAVETDGFRFHSDRLAFERDRRRSAILTAVGYEVHRVTYELLQSDLDLILGNIRRSLSRHANHRLVESPPKLDSRWG
jgi:very-short-patch-repair endonuclease